MAPKTEKPDYEKSNAVASFGGYSAQMMWGLLALCKSTDKESSIGIEIIDDVSIQNDELITLQQTKYSHDKETSPFTDLNINLWKTFAIWVSYAETKDKECKNTAFNLVTNGTVKDTHLINFLREGANHENVQKYIDGVSELKSESDEVNAKIKKCIGSEEKIEIFRKVLLKCSLIDASTNSKDLMQDISNNIGAPEKSDAARFENEIIGWFVKNVMNKITIGTEIIIKREDYNQAYASAIISCMAPQVIGSDYVDAEVDVEFQTGAESATYIRQLKLINITSEREIGSAIEDYYRFSKTRDETIEKGEVLASDWDRDAIRLQDHWQQVSQISERQLGSEIERPKFGQIIFDQCRACNSLPPLNGNEREAFIVRGHYHQLADKESVWWHPDYPEIKDA